MTSTSKKVFYPFCEAVLVKQLANGEFVTSVTGTRDGVELRINFKSKAVVVSTGGKPSIPRDIFNSISSDKLITADYFLRKDGFEAFISTLIKNPAKRNIVIIGGSHSGFSSAWVLLNGPSWFNHNKNGWDLTFDEPPNARVYKCKNKTDWGSHFNDPFSTEAPIDAPSTCHCFGAFKSKDIWKYDKVKNYPQFDDAQITIVYKERVKVFYNKVSSGIADGYSDFNSRCFTNKNGYLYSFTGLRGDAKRLYQDVVKRKEKRVRLVRADTWEQQKQYADDADYVILAWGYQTAKVPIKGHDGKEITLDAKVPGTQFDVDNKFRLKMTDGGSICKVFGSGLAFPTRTSDGKSLPEAGRVNPRADSFSLYLNYVGTKVLDSLLPKTKLLTKVHYVYNDRLGNKRRPDK